nr:hypothetical protein [Tanacetum cinerariifolium]
KQEEKWIEEEQAANAQYWKIPSCCDNDDDYNSAITPNEPVDSISMGDEHLNTILATESDEFIKSCVENLVPNPSESEGENGCDMPTCFTTLSNILFEADHKSDSSDYQSCSDEDFLEEIFSNPLFEEEIISTKTDPHHFDAESDLIESMLNHDSSIILLLRKLILFSMSSLVNSLFSNQFRRELIKLIVIMRKIFVLSRDCYDNSSPHPPEEFVSKNSDADIKYFSPFPIPDKDSDSHDDDSGRDILIREKLLDNYSLSLPVIESFYFDIPSFSRPPAKPPDGNTGILNIKMMGDDSEQKVPGLTITHVPNQEKSPDLLSHRGFEIFQPSAKYPMMIHGKSIHILDVPFFHFYPLDQLKYGGNWVKLSDLKQVLRGSLSSILENLNTLAKGFYPPSLHFLNFNRESSWSISITFRFSVRLQTPDDLSQSRLGFIEKMGVHG